MQGGRKKSTWQASATCDKLYRFVWVFWPGGVKLVSTRMRHAAHLHCFCHFLCLTEYEIVVKLFSCLKAELFVNDSTDCGTENPARMAKKAPAAVWIWKKKKKACSEKPRGSAIKRVKKFCEKKHLKHRCRADVSHNTSSSSDMLSCLSPIQMLMLNQAVQSRSISNHQVVVVFFFWFFFLQAINLPWREIKA